MPTYSHLHNHSQFSLLDGACKIEDIFAKAKKDNMRAVALTDHGNMFGVFKFVNEGIKTGIKPIVGCEFYLVEDRSRKSFLGDAKDKRFHQLLLAKNQEGYENLAKLCSLGFTEGLYSKWPRIDKTVLKKFSKGLIATSCCIGAEIPQAIIHQSMEVAEKILLEYLDVFGEDFYIELQRHGIENIDGSGKSQEDVNQALIQLAQKYKLKIIATNDTHYMDEQDAFPHDILLCVNTNAKINEPKGHGKGFRFGFPNNEFYFKTQAEMEVLFADIPEALDNTNAVVDSIETPKLTRDVLLPHYTLPEGFPDQLSYLRHLTFEGAKKRYGALSIEIEERLNFELGVIGDSGYPGYFLIVQDFTSAARQMGVAVGPGRGSAAGSAVAYCLGITNVDPIKYNLLFERFLNPERVSMPDIDIDFDDDGRQQVIDYVVNKYGKNQVAQIITYGSMAARSSLRDVGRVLDVPLPVVDRVSKLFPTHLEATLHKILAKDGIDPKLKVKLSGEQLGEAENFRKMAAENDEVGTLIQTALKLEGSIRNTGVHACGVIITPDEITKYVPIATAKDSDLVVTQFDNSVVESAGLLKMDFLGLKTLTIIRDAVNMIEENHGVKIITDEIPLDDQKTLELFQRGETSGIFQFESTGMQKHLKSLVPDKFEDLIAMNALYRPGPMEYIKNYVDRKHGKEEIAYDLAEMEEYLQDTYGITVYQEQVMLLSQKLANFTKGQADSLRKAMGKKKIEEMNKLFELYIENGQSNGHAEDTLTKIWKDWEAFASYAFNKSHSTCYAYLAFHTGYLKAHYPAEFMASVLNHNKNDVNKLMGFLADCKKQGTKVLGANVNESGQAFKVTAPKVIRFGLTGIKGLGEGPADEIIEERQKNGPFEDVFDLCTRVNLRSVNKKSLDALASCGAFDEFGFDRSNYVDGEQGSTGNELAIKYGTSMQADEASGQMSLFGEETGIELSKPKLPSKDPWPDSYKLAKEKELMGLYTSGHPLDDYKFLMEKASLAKLSSFEEKSLKLGEIILIGGFVSTMRQLVTKSGSPMMIFQLEDYSGGKEFILNGKNYSNFAKFVVTGSKIIVKGKVKNDYREPDKLALEILEVDYLEDFEKKAFKALTINLDLEKLTEETIQDIMALTSEERGGIKLNFVVNGNHSPIKLTSRQYYVNLNDETKTILVDFPFDILLS